MAKGYGSTAMMPETDSRARKPSRSAALVAACRMLASELPDDERLITDPFAELVVDDHALASAKADPALQNVISLRTRYIDDAVRAFVTVNRERAPQVLLLGAGLDARAYRLGLGLETPFFEVDFPATLHYKEDVLAAATARNPRVCVPVDLARHGFVVPLTDAGFDVTAPAIIVWEGVSMYLDSPVAEGVVEQMAELSVSGSQIVADYAEMRWFKGSDFEAATDAIAKDLDRGGEPLKAGLTDVHATLHTHGFDVLDDEATEDLRPRYGLTPRPRHYPARMVLAQRRG